MSDRLPDNIQRYIDEDGKPLLDGYIRFLNKDKSKEIDDIVSNSPMWNGGIPFATTVFGDVIAWEDGYIVLYVLSEMDYKVILSGSKFFFSNLEDAAYQKDYFQMDLYKEIKEKFGAVDSNECYVIEPIPKLGGARDIKYMNIGDLKTYLHLLV